MTINISSLLRTSGLNVKLSKSKLTAFCIFLAHLSRRLIGELIVYRSSRRPSVRPSVHIFKHEYLCNQLADWNEVLSEASLGGGGKASVSFDPDRIRTLVSMATDSSHRVIMGKTASSRFLERF